VFCIDSRFDSSIIDRSATILLFRRRHRRLDAAAKDERDGETDEHKRRVRPDYEAPRLRVEHKADRSHARRRRADDNDIIEADGARALIRGKRLNQQRRGGGERPVPADADDEKRTCKGIEVYRD
jgi:hypothetical protein